MAGKRRTYASPRTTVSGGHNWLVALTADSAHDAVTRRTPPSKRRVSMARISDLYSNYLNAAHLRGQRLTATILRAPAEQVGQDRTSKVVLYLARPSDGKPWPKGIVVNATNGRLLASAYGDDSDTWVGRQIEIWSAPTQFGGRIVDGIKLAPAQPAQPVQALPAASQGKTVPKLRSRPPRRSHSPPRDLSGARPRRTFRVTPTLMMKSLFKRNEFVGAALPAGARCHHRHHARRVARLDIRAHESLQAASAGALPRQPAAHGASPATPCRQAGAVAMRVSNFDRIAASRPVDRKANRVAASAPQDGQPWGGATLALRDQLAIATGEAEKLRRQLDALGYPTPIETAVQVEQRRQLAQRFDHYERLRRDLRHQLRQAKREHAA
jgi:hypothetical protein